MINRLGANIANPAASQAEAISLHTNLPSAVQSLRLGQTTMELAAEWHRYPVAWEATRAQPSRLARGWESQH